MKCVAKSVGYIWFVFCVTLTTPVFAVENSSNDIGLLGPIALGPGYFTSDLELKVLYDDNTTSADGTINEEIDGFVSTFRPHINYEISDYIKRFFLDYWNETALHEGSGVDDYYDNNFIVGFDYKPTSRISTGILGEYKDSHDGRGEGRAEGGAVQAISASIDRWHHWKIEGDAQYGAAGAKGRVEGIVGYRSKRYDNNRQFTFSRDRDDTYGEGSFYWRVRPKTELVFRARYENIDYNRDTPGTPLFGAPSAPSLPSIDGDNIYLLAGVKWRATYKTTGIFMLGYSERSFDSNRRDDSSGLSWFAEIDWSPRTYSRFYINSSQKIDETNGTGDSIDSKNINAGWAHTWLPRLSTSVDLGYVNDQFEGARREDDSYRAGLHVNYKMRRWLNLSSGYRYSTLDSNNKSFEYDRNILDILQATLYF